MLGLDIALHHATVGYCLALLEELHRDLLRGRLRRLEPLLPGLLLAELLRVVPGLGDQSADEVWRDAMQLCNLGLIQAFSQVGVHDLLLLGGCELGSSALPILMAHHSIAALPRPELFLEQALWVAGSCGVLLTLSFGRTSIVVRWDRVGALIKLGPFVNRQPELDGLLGQLP